MKTKPDIKKIISNIKNQKKESPVREHSPMRIDIDYTKPLHRQRDMRQEAMDIGSHGASEYFGEKNDKSK